MTRRTVLTSLGASVAALEGCSSASSDPGTETPTRSLPTKCPTSRDLAIAWPTDLDADTVESFIEAYEARYYRERVVEYDPASQLTSFELDVQVSEGPTEVGDGWQAAYSGGGAIYRPTLAVGARPADSPDDADVVPASAFDDDLIRAIRQDAMEQGGGRYCHRTPGRERRRLF